MSRPIVAINPGKEHPGLHLKYASQRGKSVQRRLGLSEFPLANATLRNFHPFRQLPLG